MAGPQPRIMVLNTFDQAFIDDLYAQDPRLADLHYPQQLQRVFETAFGVADAYSTGLRTHQCEATELIVNADALQSRWATDHRLTLAGNIHDRRRQIVAAQIDADEPDVLLVFEWCPLGDEFLAEIKSHVRLLVGQISSTLPANRSFAAYDLMLSSWPPIVDYFRTQGIAAEPLKLAFDERVLDRLSPQPHQYSVTFVGGFGKVHTERISWLEQILQTVKVDIFGYGLQQVPHGSLIHDHHRGSAWGWRMYEVLQRSRITLNLHAATDVRGQVATNVAANLRLYEATGVGTCLLTDWKENLPEMFDPGREVVVFRDAMECVEIIQHYLKHEPERATIAAAGQRRTLRDHTYRQRMGELAEIIRQHL